MKIVYLHLLLLLLYSTSIYSQNIELKLKENGLPEYKRIFSTKGDWHPIYKTENSSFFEIPTKLLYGLIPNEKPLYFYITKNNNTLKGKWIFDIKIRNSALKSSYQNNILKIESKNATISYEILISQEKKEFFIKHKEGKTDIDLNPEFGYIRIENRFIRYSKLGELKLDAYNIAIVNKKPFDIIDEKDLLSISKDVYFTTSKGRDAIELSSIMIIKVGTKTLKVSWLEGYNISIEEYSGSTKPSLIVDSQIANIKLDSSKLILSDFTKEKGYYIINIWSEYCPSCIAKIPDLNKLRVIGIRLKSNSENLIKKYHIEFPTYQISSSEYKKLNVNAFPTYYIINEKLKIIGKFHSFDAMKTVLNSL